MGVQGSTETPILQLRNHKIQSVHIRGISILYHTHDQHCTTITVYVIYDYIWWRSGLYIDLYE